MRVEVTWAGGMQFDANPPSGILIRFDTSPEDGGANTGPRPLETFLAALAACSAMDVISILRKKRQPVAAYRVEIEGDRPPAGTWPRPFTSIRLKHVISGDGVNPEAVRRAVELSDTKYCNVTATLHASPEVISEWEVNSGTS